MNKPVADVIDRGEGWMDLELQGEVYRYLPEKHQVVGPDEVIYDSNFFAEEWGVTLPLPIDEEFIKTFPRTTARENILDAYELDDPKRRMFQ